MQIVHQMTIDMARQLPAVPVSAVQGDGNTRVLEITLLENGTPWQIPEAAVADVAFRKPDGTKGIYSKLPDGSEATSAAGNVLSATLAPQMLTCPGAVLATVVFRTDAGKTLAAFPFTVKVEASPAAGAQLSEDYFNPKDLSDLRAEFMAALDAHANRRDNPHNITAQAIGARAAVYEYPSQNGGDLNSYVTETHLFVFNMTNSPSGIPHAFLDVWRANGGGFSPSNAQAIIIQRMASCYDSGNIASRISMDNGATWGEWEYENPPMQIGVEYCTTERWNAKAVYTKRINFGAMPNAANGYTGIVLPIGAKNVRLHGYGELSGGSECIDLCSHAKMWATLNADGGYIGMKTAEDLSSYTAYIIAKYTKE